MATNDNRSRTDARVTVSSRADGLVVALSGRLDAAGAASVWDETVKGASSASFARLTADCGGVTYMDGAGVALLLKLKELCAERDAAIALDNLREEDRRMVSLTWDNVLPKPQSAELERRSLAESLEACSGEIWRGIREMVAFVGESVSLLAQVVLRPNKVRWKDVVLACVNVGVESTFIIALIGFLMGLIMSFQSAISLQRFGGEIFVPNMLGLVMFREMGPLVTSILLAARSGSAFAAEIGTMKINEELDALTTMGLSPMRFLVVPKLLATMLMVPLMTMFFNLASLVGGALVMLSMGYPLVTFTSRVFSYVGMSDFWGGMSKGLVFSFLVAGVGCLRGMQTRSGASAVGLSTTSAVVSGIILIAFADGIFAVAFYYLDF
ncbi:putative phospholipid ABC transporter permease protein MlaE [Pseudodesulfovibrio hydrargyri]|uniref:Putative phospholipid ABC transporter permease protein MlaE n=1 Tax=Pseudodesulfovibrio hydrargyri TaxID=2125990 RepID=A0A1J5N6K9_9BACT|nr:ABC transporter permease [Pseudodesulfovibrio hydrargyri]OIQ51267.1 putative phospholipid ABC transporter permease protein MlaE [Pseudodesulfovibrio hydrargyri]